MSPQSPPLVFDRSRLRRRRNRAALSFADYAFLKSRVSNDLAERLADTSRRFPLALDLGAHGRELAAALRASGQVDTVIAVDSASEMLREAETSVCADEEALPFKDAAFDLVSSALSLHWVNDLPGAMVQVRRALKPDGLFLGALFGARTLSELRTCLIEAESELTGGAGQRVSPLPRLQDMAGLLQRTEFALPVADVDVLTVRYDTPFGLLADLKGMGERASFAAPAARGLSRRVLSRMAELYAARFSDPDGRIRATFEVIYLSGWAPAPTQPKPLRPGSGKASLADAVRKAGETSKK